MVDTLDIVALEEVRSKLLKFVTSDLFLASNTGMEAEDTTPIDLFLFSDKLVKNESAFNSVIRGGGGGRIFRKPFRGGRQNSITIIIGICH